MGSEQRREPREAAKWRQQTIRANRHSHRLRRAAAQLVAAVVGAVAGLGIAILLSIGVIRLWLGSPPYGEDFLAVLAFELLVGASSVVLLTVGGAVGAYVVGNRAPWTGSFWWTLLGSTLQTAVLSAAALFIWKAELAIQLPQVFGILFIVPAGAVIAFNLTRRHRVDGGRRPGPNELSHTGEAIPRRSGVGAAGRVRI
jgi:hypothetical protein